MPRAGVFIAVIKRCAGGFGVKTCKDTTQRNPVSSSFFPPGVSMLNAPSYFRKWSKGKTDFISFGSTRKGTPLGLLGETKLTLSSYGKTSIRNASSAAFNGGMEIPLYGAISIPFTTETGLDDSSSSKQPRKKFTLRNLEQKYSSKSPITMVTAYDYPSAQIANKAGIDLILVGDSVGMVVQGHDQTTSVTMDQMVYHCQAVVKGATKGPLIVGDMPFGSYLEKSEALKNACRLVKEGGVDVVKLEGGRRVCEQVKAIVDSGIPVMGHIGLTPQTAAALGGFTLQGKTAQAAEELLRDALALQEAGAFALVLEMVPTAVAECITCSLRIPTIGIGAGNKTSGQVLVFHDLLGIFDKFKPKFCKQYAKVGSTILSALESYRNEVLNSSFPGPEHSFSMDEQTLKHFANNVKELTNGWTPTSEGTKTKQCNQELPKKLKVVIIGGGAMGTLTAGKLALASSNAQTDVWLLSNWKEHIASIQQQGLQIHNLFENSDPTFQESTKVSFVKNLQATNSVKEILKTGTADLVIVLVKGTDTKRAAAQALELIKGNPQGIVLTLQNGIGNMEVLSNVIGSERIFQGITTHGAIIPHPGIVYHTGCGLTTLFEEGCDNSKQTNTVLSLLTKMLQTSSMKTELLSSDIKQQMIWQKLISNAAINPLTALCRVPNGRLVEHPLEEWLSAVVEECLLVARAAGVSLPNKNVLKKAVMDIVKVTTLNNSSMLRDVLRGVPTEIDTINGQIVNLGKQFGIATPVNSALKEMVTLLQAGGYKALGTQNLSDTEKRISHIHDLLSQKLNPTHKGCFDSTSNSTTFRSLIPGSTFYQPVFWDVPWLQPSLGVAHYSSLSTPSQRRSFPQLVESISDWRKVRKLLVTSENSRVQKRLGFVPTMGALHEGHLELVNAAIQQCDSVVMSIFVNPKQFGPNEDLDRYPRQLQKDIEVLTASGGVDVVFAPSVEGMYQKNNCTFVDLYDIDNKPEGTARPGFFRGVATVCSKLFNIIQPTDVYFGQKDALQCIVIKRIVEELNMPIEVHVVPTVREQDGLAKSSRNVYLSTTERQASTIIYQSLQAAKQYLKQHPTTVASELKSVVEHKLKTEPLLTKIDYVSLMDGKNANELTDEQQIQQTINEIKACAASAAHVGVVLSVAVKIGKVRLIDNVILN